MHGSHSHNSARLRLARCRGRRIATTAASAIALAALSACASRPVPPDIGIPWGATVKSIVANPQQADGKLVTVSGEVNRIFGPRWFSIGGEGFDGGEELLVAYEQKPVVMTDFAVTPRVDVLPVVAVPVPMPVPVSAAPIIGVLRAMPGDLSSVRASWSLSAANQTTLAREAVYLQATGIYMHGMAHQGPASSSRIRVQKDGR